MEQREVASVVSLELAKVQIPQRERETERGREEYEVISPAHEFEGTR